MVTKVEIVDNENTPIGYLHKLKAFKNGKTYEFKEGVNIIEMTRGYKNKIIKLVKELI